MRKKTSCFIATAFAACASFANLDTSLFVRQIEITVPSASLPSGKTVSSMPVLVRLSASSVSGFDYADFKQTGGADLAFTDEAGNVLPHEIDTWDATGESLVWVKIPVLKSGAKFYAFYGSESYSPQDSSAQVWSDYAGVWHMSEASGEVADSTGHGLTATPSGAAAERNVGISGGVVGMARQNGGNGSSAAEDRAYLSIPSYDSLGLGDTFTASGFFRIAGAGGWYRLFSRRYTGTAGGWGQEVLWSDPETVYVYGASGETPTAAISGIAAGYKYLTFVYSGSSCKVYSDGVLVDTLAITSASDNGCPLSIGCTASGDDWSLYGDYDEVRLSKGELSAERIAADFATATSSAFLSCGEATSVSKVFKVDRDAYSKFMRITAASDAISSGETLSGFVALVRLSENIEGFSYSDFQSGGADLVFAAPDGSILPHEIDTWDPTGESLVWVRIPSFENGQSIYAYWGASGASSVPATAVWSDYAGVWHMDANQTVEPDATGNGLDATPKSNSLTAWGGEAEDTTGKMKAFTDGGVTGTYRRNQTDYAGFIHNWLEAPSCDFLGLGDTFTVSGWFKQVNIYGWHRFISRKVSASDAGGWDVEWWGVQETKIGAVGGGDGATTADLDSIKGVWAHLAFVYEGDTVKIYRDGVLKGSGWVVAPADNGNPIAIGCNIDGTEAAFEGYYDEVRLGAGAYSAERVAADVKTVSDAAFFEYSAVSIPAADEPVFDATSLSLNNGVIEATVSMTSGKGGATARFQTEGSYQDVVLESGTVEAPQTWQVRAPSSLSADKTYSVAAIAVNSRGGTEVFDGEECFYNGTLQAAKVSDGSEDGLVPAVFEISRADTYGDLDVNYVLSGSALAGTDYEGSATGTATIPAGSTSVRVSVVPKVNAASSDAATVAISIADGLYLASSSTASAAIANIPPPKRSDFRRKVVFTVPADFLDDGETLENFPVLVRLSASAISGFSYSDFLLADGADMMFTDSSNNPIPFEIDTWNEDGESLVWVAVPSLSKGCTFKMFYGGGANTAGLYFEKWSGYAAVWHMGEAEGTAYDSTANAYDAEIVQNNPGTGDLTESPEGAVGVARFNQRGSTWYSVDYETYSRDPDVRARSRRNYLRARPANGGGSKMTFSGWWSLPSASEGGKVYLAYQRASGYYRGWAVRQEDDAYYSSNGRLNIKVEVADGGGTFAIPNPGTDWMHLLFSFDTATVDGARVSCARMYLNGEEVELSAGSGKGSTTIVGDNPHPLTLGNIDSVSDGIAFNGCYDEVRMRESASTPHWAKAEYRTVADSQFLSPSAVLPAVDGLSVIIR